MSGYGVVQIRFRTKPWLARKFSQWAGGLNRIHRQERLEFGQWVHTCPMYIECMNYTTGLELDANFRDNSQ